MDFKFENDIILENDLLMLRPIVTADVENLLQIATADETLLQFSPKPIYTRSLLEAYIDFIDDFTVVHLCTSATVKIPRDT